MRRLLPIATFCIALVSGSALASPGSLSPEDAARIATRDNIAQFMAPDHRPVKIQVRYCRRHNASWHGCRVQATAKTTCRILMRVRRDSDGTYSAWIPSMRCR